jgi:hypothetical protein
MERTSSWLNEESMSNRYIERSSTEPHHVRRLRKYMRRKQPRRLLRVVICKEQTRHRYSIAKKNSYSSNFWNGGAIRKKFRNELSMSPGIKMLLKMQQSSRTEPTGTQSRFVSCIELRAGIAAVAAIALLS